MTQEAISKREDVLTQIYISLSLFLSLPLSERDGTYLKTLSPNGQFAKFQDFTIDRSGTILN